MSKQNKQVYVVEIHGQAQNLQKTLKDLRDEFGDLSLPPSLEKNLAKIEDAAQEVVTATKDGVISREGFKQTEKDSKKIVQGMTSLQSQLDIISSYDNKKLANLLPNDTKQKIDAISVAYGNYVKTLQAVMTQEKEVAKLQEKAKELDAALQIREDDKTAKKMVLEAAQARAAAHQKTIEAIEAEISASEELESKRAKLEKAKKEGRSEKTIKVRESEVEAAEQKAKESKDAVGAIDPKALDEARAAREAVILANKEYATSEKEVEEATQGVEAQNKKIAAAELLLKNAQEQLTNENGESAEKWKLLQKAIKEINPSLNLVRKEGEKTEDWLERLQDEIGGLSDQEVEKLRTKLTAMSGSFESARGQVENYEDAIESAKDETMRFDEQAAKQEAFTSRIKSFLGVAGAAQVLRRVLNDAMATVKELDATMTEMAVVTDFGVSDYWEQLPEYTQRANDLGLAINDVYQADMLFYQQGLKTNEVVQISTETMRMARIAGLDTAEATDRMTAALRGFNMELNEVSAQKVADVYSELAAITAADVDEISTAMTKTASIASNAGMEFETTAAFLSQIIETTRESAETAGTAMKTIIARFQELKKDPSEIGEVDGEIIDANKIEGALRSVGVSLRDASGQFRELDDVFLELASKWDGLDTNTQRYIATIAAGSRQQSRFIAMMSDYGRTQELVTAANNSAGASQEQFEKTLESVGTKLNRLKNAWDEFTMGILESDLVKFGVDVLTKFLEVINKATSGFDGLAGSITKIVSVVAVFKLGQALFKKFEKPLISFYTKVTAESYKAGKNAMDAYYKGSAEKAREIESQNANINTNTTEETPAEEGAAKKKTLKDVVGLSDFETYKKADNEAKHYRSLLGKDGKEAFEKNQQRLDEMNQKYTFGKKGRVYEKGKKGKGSATLTKKDGDKIKKEYDELNKKAKEYSDAEKGYAKASKEKWDAMSGVVSKMGATAATAGLAVSALGGFIGSLGPECEEAGQFITGLGNLFTLAGTAASQLGPTVLKFVDKFKAQGKSTLAAWGWVAIIIGAIMVIVSAVIGIIEAVNNASPEKKLESARESADAAAAAADQATEAYNNLRDSLDSIEGHQDALDDLVIGTDAWKASVSELNAEILELIQQYPELAQFVGHKNGVMSIDFDDAGVQAALDEAQQTAANAQIVAAGANLNVLQAQDTLAYDALDKKAKIDYFDPKVAAGLAYTGTVAGSAGAGAGAAALLGLAGGPFAPLLSAAGALGGAVIAGATAIGTGAAEEAAEAAEEAAIARNERTQSSVEGVARALASGAIVDTGSGYSLAKGYSEAQLYNEFGIGSDQLNTFYSQLSDATEELMKFGAGLNETRLQSEKYYDSMAVQIYNQIDQSDWSENDKVVADNILDGASLEARRGDILSELDDVDMLDRKLDSELEGRMTTAIQQAYGAGAQLVEGENGFEIQNSTGEVVLANVTSDALKNIVATQEANQEQTEVGENLPQIVDGILEAFKTSEDEDLGKALLAALDDETGVGLTGESLELLNSMLEEKDDEALTDIFNSSEELQDAFGDAANFIYKIRNPVNLASEGFAEAADKIEEFNEAKLQDVFNKLTHGAQKGLLDDSRMGAVSSRGTEEEISEVEKNLADILSGDNAEEIAAYLNSFKWDGADAETFTAAAHTLINDFGVAPGIADALTKSISNALDAIPRLTVLDEAFGAFYQSTKKVAEALEEATDLQWKYERMLANGADALDLSANLEAQRNAYLTAGQVALEAADDARERQHEKYAEGVSLEGLEGHDLTELVSFDPNTNSYDSTKLNEYMKKQGWDKDSSEYEIATKWFNEVVEANDLAKDQIKQAKDAYVAIEELNETAKEGYANLWEHISDALTTSIQKAISLEEETLAATREGNDRLISKLQEQIDTDRQERENEEAEKNIADLQSQAAYLGMDTSGANALELLQLEEEIAQAEQDYQDSLIDQSIQSLQDDNEKAFEQRERQIAIAEAQLDIYRNSESHQDEVQAAMDEYMDEYEEYEQQYSNWQKQKDAQELSWEAFQKKYSDETLEHYNSLKDSTENLGDAPTFKPQDTALGQLMVENGVLQGMSTMQKDAFWQQLSEDTADAAYYTKLLDEYSEGDGDKDQMGLLRDIVENTGIEQLTNVLWADKVAAANKDEVAFGDKQGKDGFKPDVVKETTEAYGKDHETMADDVSTANSAYTDANSSALKASDENATTEYNAISPYIESTGTSVTPSDGEEFSTKTLSQKDFYAALNKGDSIEFGKTTFSARTLVESLADGDKVKIDDKEYIKGSYEHYIALVKKESAAEISQNQASKRNEALEEARGFLMGQISGGRFTGLGDTVKDPAFANILEKWQHAGGKPNDLYSQMAEVDEKDLSGYIKGARVESNKLSKHVKLTGIGDESSTQGQKKSLDEGDVPEEAKTLIGKVGYDSPVYHKGDIYWKTLQTGYSLGSDLFETKFYRLKNTDEDTGGGAKNTLDAYKKRLLEYKTGGLADFTGPAWLDGTKSKPEIVLNQRDSANFLILRDILGEVLQGSSTINNTQNNQNSGDNHFDIDINVEKIDSDYDVEQIVNKIRSMLYEDASYRNVNAVGLIR